MKHKTCERIFFNLTQRRKKFIRRRNVVLQQSDQSAEPSFRWAAAAKATKKSIAWCRSLAAFRHQNAASCNDNPKMGRVVQDFYGMFSPLLFFQRAAQQHQAQLAAQSEFHSLFLSISTCGWIHISKIRKCPQLSSEMFNHDRYWSASDLLLNENPNDVRRITGTSMCARAP